MHGMKPRQCFFFQYVFNVCVSLESTLAIILRKEGFKDKDCLYQSIP